MPGLVVLRVSLLGQKWSTQLVSHG